ncbi:hypothetical protein E2C01_095122 [Portunus trituberculatus]|uniref:Uncharacterized protein n=1 Tax=Portunus trituberculatus TaxID=210409 RepID=A0A5B7K4Y2_PORTR|nr:hypothetical protein [Portunus trituberculatus]
MTWIKTPPHQPLSLPVSTHQHFLQFSMILEHFLLFPTRNAISVAIRGRSGKWKYMRVWSNIGVQ